MVSEATSSTQLNQPAASAGTTTVAEPQSHKHVRQEVDDCDDATAPTAMSWSCISQSFAGCEASLEDMSSNFSLAEGNEIEEEQDLRCFNRPNSCEDQKTVSDGRDHLVSESKESGEAEVGERFQHSSSTSPGVARKSPVDYKDLAYSPCQTYESSQLHRCKSEMLEVLSKCSAEHKAARQDSKTHSVRIASTTHVRPGKVEQDPALSTAEQLVHFENGVRNDKSMDFRCSLAQQDHACTPSIPGPLIDLEAIATIPTYNLDRPGAYVVRTMRAPSNEQLVNPMTIDVPSTYLVEASLVVDDASIRYGDGVGAEGGMDVFEAKPIKEISFWKSRRIQCAVLWIVFLTSGAAVGVTIGLMMNHQREVQNSSKDQDANVKKATTTQSSSVPSTPPSQAPRSTDLILELQTILPFYTVVALQTDDSPQSMAFQWVRQNPPTANNSLGRMTQRFALATLFYATNGGKWDNNGGWLNATSHECDWFMSSSSKMDSSCSLVDESIVALRLFQNSLGGTIPSEVALLTSMRTLQLELNPALGGIIPAALNGNSLEEVQLNGNGLTGTLPDFNPNITAFLAGENNLSGGLPSSYANWTRLEHFSVRSNLISGRFSEDIFSKWIMATSIDVSNNNFNGSVSNKIGLLSCLTTLSLKTNNFTGQLPSELGKLTGLHELYLGENRFTSTIPSELRNARRLQFLDLESNLHTGTIPSDLALLADLEELKLGSNALVGTLPDALIALKRVRILSFGENGLNGTIPVELAPQVQILSLHMNNFTGTIPNFGNASSLIELRLNKNNLTGTLPTELGLLRSLEVLDLEENLLSGGIPSALGALVNIKEMILSGNNLNGTVPVELCALIESNKAKVEIDCDQVACDCGCTCCGTSHNGTT